MASEPSVNPSFFVLEPGALRSTYDVEVDEVEHCPRGEATHCPICGGAISMLKWLPPHRVELTVHGEKLGDFAQTAGDDLLISERLASAYQEEGLKGLEGFHPVEVVRVRRKRRSAKPSEVPRYLAVTPVIGSAAVDVAHSRIRYNELPTCDECLYGTKDGVHGFTLKPETWNGDDIFRPRGLFGFAVVSERFERFLAKHQFTNMRLTPTETYVWDPFDLSSL